MERFPADFAFQLTRGEYESLRSQIVILKAGRGAHRKYPPYVFTEHGAVMGASVLNSPNHQSHASHRTGALHGHGLAANLVHAHREAYAGHLAGAALMHGGRPEPDTNSTFPRRSSLKQAAGILGQPSVGCRYSLT